MDKPHGVGRRFGSAALARQTRQEWSPSRNLVRLVRDYRLFSFLAGLPRPPLGVDRQSRLAFVVGCGRSGTSILGDLLELHPAISYRFEPLERWAAVDLDTDMTGLFRSDRGKCVMESGDATPEITRRFWRLFRPPRQPGRWLVEKTPVNAMRLSYLGSIAPHARFVVIVRDARKVINSIVLRASSPGIRIEGRPPANGWWGVGDLRWIAIRADAIRHGWLPEEYLATDDDAIRAACEWIGTCESLDRSPPDVKDRATFVRYEELISNAQKVLRAVANDLELQAPSSWLDRAQDRVRVESRPPVDPILPDGVKTIVNEWQRRMGYLPIG